MDATGSTSTYEPILASSEEARQVIEIETKSWEAESKEPAFLIAMRYAALARGASVLGCMHAHESIYNISSACYFLPKDALVLQRSLLPFISLRFTPAVGGTCGPNMLAFSWWMTTRS